MASSWGNSWLTSWLNSWGAIGAPAPETFICDLGVVVSSTTIDALLSSTTVSNVLTSTTIDTSVDCH